MKQNLIDKVREWALSIMLVSILTGCMAVQPAIAPGDILPVGVGQVVWGIQQAAAAKPGTALLTDPTGQYFLAAWPCAGSQCWSFVAKSVEGYYENVSGNIATVNTWNELKACLDTMKWAPVTAGALLEALGEQAVAVISRVLTTPILIMPSMLDPLNIIQPKVQA